MNIWIPDKLYHTLPWLCIAMATLAWFIPASWVAIACAVLLYSYAAWSLSRRAYDRINYTWTMFLVWFFFCQ